MVRLPEDIALDQSRSAIRECIQLPIGLLLPLRFGNNITHEFLDFGQNYQVQLADGPAGLPALTQAARRLAGPGAQPPSVSPANADSRRGSFTTPVSLETTALLALGIGLAVAAAATTVLLLRTEQRFHDRETPKLQGLGLTPSQLVGLAAVRTVPARRFWVEGSRWRGRWLYRVASPSGSAGNSSWIRDGR